MVIGRWTRGQAAALATIIAGTLDILVALLLARQPAKILLQTIASAVIGERAFGGGWTTALAGLALHYLLALGMAGLFVFEIATRRPVARHPLRGAMLYGVVLWAVMYLVVLPLRWPASYPRFTLGGTAVQLFCHVFLVGLPIGWATSRLRR